MLAIALSCAALGILLGARCKAFSLLPGVLLALGLTILTGLLNGGLCLGAALVSMGNFRPFCNWAIAWGGIVSNLYKRVDHGVLWYRPD